MGGGGGGDTIYPAQPSYGEGMREALEAQVALLTGEKVGEADFRGVGSLEDLLPLEQSIREKTAQADTDILRQTLLGGGSKETYAPDGKVIVGYEDAPDASGGYKIVDTSTGTRYRDGGPMGRGYSYDWGIRVIDTKTGNVVHEENGEFNHEPAPPGQSVPIGMTGTPIDVAHMDRIKKDVTQKSLEKKDLFSPEQISTYFNADYPDSLILTTGGGVEESKPIFKKNPDGTDFVAEPGTFEPGEVIRAGDGMLDLLGDKRDIVEYETRTATQADVDNKLASEVGEQFVAQKDSVRKAGFDESDNFLGLSAFGEDIQRANLSRQREADLQDVSRLSPLFTDIMEDYKPGTQEALGEARTILAEQADALTGDGAITVPSDSTYGGDLGRQSLEAATAYAPSAGVTGGTYTGELGAGDDALRGALLADAKQALGQGLTDREERQIAEAARARSTMMGRTFDQSGAIAEAEARVAEDNQRRMQNRAFAQQALGQEAGLQEADLGRGMQAQLTNQQATNQALQAGMAAGLGQEQAQAQLAQAANLAEQGQTQQAKQFGVGATMDAQRANEQLKQQGILGYIQAAGGLAALEDQTTLDPFQAVLGRGGGNALQQGQSVFGQAGYGLQSAPQYLNPESGLGFIQNQATNAANMYSAQVAADATRDAGKMNMFGSIAGAGLGGFLKRK
jgi:hypothetical protein